MMCLMINVRNTMSDCDGVCEALFGEKLGLDSGDG